MNYKDQFPNLFQFFGGYFHQDAGEDYSGLQEAFQAFVEDNLDETVSSTRRELSQFSQLNLEAQDLENALIELGCEYWHGLEKGELPSQWLKKIKSMLFES